MGAADEETGSEFGTVYLLQKGVGKGADFAIVSEPTSLRVELGNRGLRWIDIIIKGNAMRELDRYQRDSLHNRQGNRSKFMTGTCL
jgi:acetylornithine deacetylase/succinyl-diaminopimelate desuccinylase-like protein